MIPSMIPQFGALRIIETPHAMAEPSAQPRTDDMRAMVDHLRALGQIRRMPAALEVNGQLFIHPSLMRAMRERMRETQDRIADSVFFNASRREGWL